MLTKNQIADEVENMTGVKPQLVKNVLDAIATIGREEVGLGNDFTIPGLVKISWRFRKPSKKGERWKKGDERENRFTGEVAAAEEDSPEVKAQVRLVAVPHAKLKSVAPKQNDRPAQTKFLGNRVGKAIASRLGAR